MSNTIITMTGATIDLATGVVARDGNRLGVVQGKSIRTATAVLAKCPAGTAAILWMPIAGRSEPATVALGETAAAAWDAVQDARLDAIRQSPEGRRSALVAATERAARQYTASLNSERTRDADRDAMLLLDARKALADFDAANPAVVATIREQQAKDAAILAGAGSSFGE